MKVPGVALLVLRDKFLTWLMSFDWIFRYAEISEEKETVSPGSLDILVSLFCDFFQYFLQRCVAAE